MRDLEFVKWSPQKELNSYVSDMVFEGKTLFEELDDDEKEILAGLIIRSDKTIHRVECINENVNIELEGIVDLLAIALSGNENSKKKALNEILQNIAKHFEKRINDLLYVEIQFQKLYPLEAA